MLLWLWHRPAATAGIGPLAWESPYATGAALKRPKKKKKKKLKKKELLNLLLKHMLKFLMLFIIFSGDKLSGWLLPITLSKKVAILTFSVSNSVST